MNLNKTYRILLIFCSPLVLNTAYAATETTTFTVTASIASTCTVAATTLAFGSYAPSTSTPTAASNTVNITCTNGTGYTVALDKETTAGGAVTQRLMAGPGGATLNYNIYTTVAATTVWGHATGATVTQAATGNGLVQPLTGYGQIAPSQYNTAGSYTDTITVTVTY